MTSNHQSTTSYQNFFWCQNKHTTCVFSPLIIDNLPCVLLLQEEEEENFMVGTVCTAAEEGNIDAIQALLEEASNFDITTTNKVNRHNL